MQMIYDKMQGKGHSQPVWSGSKGIKIHNSLRLCIVITLLFFLSTGCVMLGPAFQKPMAPVAENWLDLEEPSISHDKEELAKWWMVFNDPVLNTLMEQAHAQNLTLQIAGLRILEARAQMGIATGQRYPQSQQLNA